MSDSKELNGKQLQADNQVEGAESATRELFLHPNVSTRQKPQVTREAENEFSTMLQEFTQRVRLLKKLYRKADIVLSEEEDVSRVRASRETVSGEFESFVSFYENLEDVAETIVPEEVVEVYRSMESEGELLLKSFNSRIRALLNEIKAKSANIKQRKSSITARVDNADSELVEDGSTRQLIETLCSQLSLSRLPPPEPLAFSGDVLMYQSWKRSFETLISSRGVPNDERLHYLNRYIEGEARECVECYLLTNSSTAFEDSVKELDRRFGNSFIVGEKMRDKIDSFPKISGKDSQGLRRYADYLRQCESCMSAVPGLRFLDDPRENRRLLQKCPDWLVQRWKRRVVRHQRESGDFPTFSMFVAFLSEEAEVANEPCTSFQGEAKSKSDSNVKGSSGSDPIFKRAKSHAVESKKVSDSKKASCLYCEKSHPLAKCFKFERLSVPEKNELVLSKKLCRGCLGTGHINKKCKNKAKCDACQQSHPTCLHDCVETYRQRSVSEKSNLQPEAQPFVPSQSNSISSSSADSDLPVQSHSNAAYGHGGCLSSMIVPVYVSHKDNPTQERLVYALLDNQSDTSFVLEDTRKALGLNGPKVNLSLSTMFAEDCRISCYKVNGLLVRAFNADKKIPLPSVYSRPIMPANRAHIPSIEMAKRWAHLQFLKTKLMPVCDTAEIGLLIGYNCNRALIPRQVVASKSGPFAQRTDLGWGIVGIVDNAPSKSSSSFSHRVVAYEANNGKVNHVAFRTQTKEVVLPRQILGVLESDFKDVGQGVGMSVDDKRFLNIMKSNVKIDSEGHYVLPLPFKDRNVELYNNRSVAEKRLYHLKAKFDRDPNYRDSYTSFMSEMVASGYAQKVDRSDLHKVAWFLPHHGVTNKSKLRVVFDCSAKHRGKSINDCLLQGPDLNNSLIGVLLRFRKEAVAFSCDITKMYYQFRVPERDRFYMCYLWWDDGQTDQEPCVYCMKVHTFGLKSSPSCCVFGLQQAANDNELEYGVDVANFLRDHFYVDDGLISVKSNDLAIDLIKRTIKLCDKAQLRLHKFVSNSEEVLVSVPPERRLNGKEVDLRFDQLPMERTLGVEWCVQSDTFQFRGNVKESAMTRRGLLASVASLYDPLGFIAPFTLIGKRILQRLCLSSADWDEKVSPDLQPHWQRWLVSCQSLVKIQIPRSLKPPDLDVREIEFHHFCDASTSGYGCCSYLRQILVSGAIHVSFLMGKSRVSPIKPMTVPRLELSAAVLAVKMAHLLDSELGYINAKHFFWCDSKVVLGYIGNTSKRFHVFVSNRVGFIHSQSSVDQWRYIPGNLNVADIASRGCLGEELKSSKWFSGPDFLWESSLPSFQTKSVKVDELDPEVRTAKVLAGSSLECFDVNRFAHVSNWSRLKRVVALILLLKQFLKEKKLSRRFTRARLSVYESISVEVLNQAESEILKGVQQAAFPEEIAALSRSEPVKLASPISKLDCFLKDSLLRVGGRLRQSAMLQPWIHPIVIPKQSHIGNLIISHCHSTVFHQGKGMTLNAIRSSGYWIIGGRLSVSRHIFRCVTCRRLRADPVGHKMADLPADRVTPSAPFTFCGVDLFGPFVILDGRKELNRWGCIFTCLSSRAVHLEVVNALSSSSFINALRRFIALRGPISLLRCDQGTNFVGANKELQECFRKISDGSIKQFLLDNNCIFEFKPNPPAASHMSGAWERLIRSVRSILATLLFQHSSQLDDESLRTFLCEVSAVINSRPLTLESFSDPNFPEPLTPNHLLTMKTKLIVSPPSEFQREDLYSVKRWRRTQYLVDQFWSRWKSEYTHWLQSRSKWVRPKRNLKIGDVVILKDEAQPRNLWRVARVADVKVSSDGHVRSVKIMVGARNLDKSGKRITELLCLERPVNKLVLLVEA